MINIDTKTYHKFKNLLYSGSKAKVKNCAPEGLNINSLLCCVMTELTISKQKSNKTKITFSKRRKRKTRQKKSAIKSR